MYCASDPRRLWDLVGIVLLFDFVKKKLKYNNVIGNRFIFHKSLLGHFCLLGPPSALSGQETSVILYVYLVKTVYPY